MKNFFSFALLFLCLSGCYSVETNTIYNRSLTQGYSTSKPIYLSFADNKKAPFHFLLKHEVASNTYLLHVR